MDDETTLYSGGRVLVLDGVTPPQEALVVRDGRVAGVGDAADMARLAGTGARRVSVGGATIMPGLIDTHPHLLREGRGRRAERHPPRLGQQLLHQRLLHERAAAPAAAAAARRVLAGTWRAMAAYNRLGVTTVYEGHAMGGAEIAAYRMLRNAQALSVPVLTALEAESYGLPWTAPLSMQGFEEEATPT